MQKKTMPRGRGAHELGGGERRDQVKLGKSDVKASKSGRGIQEGL